MPNQPVMIRFRSQFGMLACALLLPLAACASEDPDAQMQGTALAAGTGASAAGSSAPVAPADNLMSAIQAFVDSGSEQLDFNCPCFVEMGAYKSVDECLMFQAPRKEWASCGSRALAKYDSAETRGVFTCLADIVRESTVCLKSKPCDPVARAECGASPLQCIGEHADLGLALFTECPDLALLTRQ